MSARPWWERRTGQRDPVVYVADVDRLFKRLNASALYGAARNALARFQEMNRQPDTMDELRAAIDKAEDVDRVKGFTLIELMMVVVILGTLVAIGLPNFLAMQDRAREASTKANMHTMQLAAEDFAAEHDGAYAELATQVAGGAQQLGINGPVMWTGDVRCDFPNPFDGTRGNHHSYENGDWQDPPSEYPGIVAYVGADSGYVVKGEGAHAPLGLVIRNAQ